MPVEYITIENNQSVPVSSIPVLTYGAFIDSNTRMVSQYPAMHCVNYFACEQGDSIKLFCCIADDEAHEIRLSSCLINRGDNLDSFTARHLSFEKYEREIHENFDITYTDHPWLKPVRYPNGRFDTSQTISNYPFYTIPGEELHEVGVGPIHAGVIEPGHFRFICNGEQILHLEIQLGYQHRGIENLFLEAGSLLRRATLAENIAGDTVVGHSTAFAHIWESLCGWDETPDISYARTLALELERIAIHTGDLSALCADIAYQLGSAVFGRLRTPIVNFMQEWGGNRLSKGIIRPFRTPFPFTPELAERIINVLDTYGPEFVEMSRQLFLLPSALSRFERTGVVSEEDAAAIGVVGMAARTCGIPRDIRASHPHSLYKEWTHRPLVMNQGDVFARVKVRCDEIAQSMGYARLMMDNVPPYEPDGREGGTPVPGMFALSLVEGWRGEICHCAITDSKGKLLIYKIKDPSFHNWLALALAVRNNEISDFPVCNKSFNLSYAGHDL